MDTLGVRASVNRVTSLPPHRSAPVQLHLGAHSVVPISLISSYLASPILAFTYCFKSPRLRQSRRYCSLVVPTSCSNVLTTPDSWSDSLLAVSVILHHCVALLDHLRSIDPILLVLVQLTSSTEHSTVLARQRLTRPPFVRPAVLVDRLSVAESPSNPPFIPQSARSPTRTMSPPSFRPERRPTASLLLCLGRNLSPTSRGRRCVAVGRHSRWPSLDPRPVLLCWPSSAGSPASSPDPSAVSCHAALPRGGLNRALPC